MFPFSQSRLATGQLAVLPNCDVRVSLDGRRTRLHAKAPLLSGIPGLNKNPQHTRYGFFYLVTISIEALSA
jgi:hypothetical protein